MKTALAELVEYLDARDVRAAVIGAMALTFHGGTRATIDVDLLAVDARVLSSDFWDAFPLDAEVRRGDFDDPLAGVVRVRPANQRPVDLVVAKYSFAEDVIGRAVEGVVAGTNLRVARLADVILLKLFAGGPQDAWDVHQALAVGGPNVRDEVEQHVGALPRDAQELWETIKTR